VEFVRLGLSTVQRRVPAGRKVLDRFVGIVIKGQGDGRYKRIGRFDHKDIVDINPEGFFESRNSIEPWTVARGTAVIKEITLF
jgi:hypothetical protein